MSPAKVLSMGVLAVCAVLLASSPLWADEGAPAKEKPAAKAPAAKGAEKPAGPDKSEAAKVKAEKIIADATKELGELTEAETKVATSVVQNEAKALEKVDDRNTLTEKLEKGQQGKGVKEYRDVFMGGVAQLTLIEKKYSRVKLELASLQREMKILPEDIKGKVEDLNTKIAAQRRANFEKMATWYETICDYKNAVAVLVAVYKEIPENKREGEKTLKDRITKLQEKVAPAKKDNRNKSGSGHNDWSGTGGSHW